MKLVSIINLEFVNVEVNAMDYNREPKSEYSAHKALGETMRRLYIEKLRKRKKYQDQHKRYKGMP